MTIRYVAQAASNLAANHPTIRQRCDVSKTVMPTINKAAGELEGLAHPISYVLAVVFLILLLVMARTSRGRGLWGGLAMLVVILIVLAWLPGLWDSLIPGNSC